MDKQLSSVEFKLPVLFAKDVEGKFDEINGLIEIDLNDIENNKAIFSIEVDSIVFNYKKYNDLILSDSFFDVKNFPIAILDTKKFSYKYEENFQLNVELKIKDTNKLLPTKVNVNKLTKDLIQIKAELEISRSDFNIGTGKWSNTLILKDKAKIKANLFLFRE